MANMISKLSVEYFLDIFHLTNPAVLEPGAVLPVTLECFLDTVWEFRLQHL